MGNTIKYYFREEHKRFLIWFYDYVLNKRDDFIPLDSKFAESVDVTFNHIKFASEQTNNTFPLSHSINDYTVLKNYIDLLLECGYYKKQNKSILNIIRERHGNDYFEWKRNHKDIFDFKEPKGFFIGTDYNTGLTFDSRGLVGSNFSIDPDGNINLSGGSFTIGGSDIIMTNPDSKKR